MAQRSLSLGARFRRQPLAPSGATLRAPGVDRESPAKQRACRAINAELRSREPLLNVGKEEMLIAKNLLTREASYKVFGTHRQRMPAAARALYESEIARWRQVVQ